MARIISRGKGDVQFCKREYAIWRVAVVQRQKGEAGVMIFSQSSNTPSLPPTAVLFDHSMKSHNCSYQEPHPFNHLQNTQV